MGNSSSKQEGPGRDQGPGGILGSPYLIDTLETSDFVILVQFNPDQQWHRFKVLYNMFFLKDDFDVSYNKILITPNLSNYEARQVQVSQEYLSRVDMGVPAAYVIDPEIKDSISGEEKGWVRIEEDQRSLLLDYTTVEVDKFKWLPTFKMERYKHYLDKKNLDPSKIYFFIFDPSKRVYDPVKHNLDLDTTIKPSDKVYDIHMAHAVPKRFVKDIIQQGKICIDQRCPVAYDEKSGIFLGNQEPNYYGYQFPGIYMELFEHSKIKPFSPPMTLEDPFFHFRSMNVDTSSGVVYGEVGFIFPFEEIFGKYVVSLKKDFQTGKGENITLDEYVYKYAGEAVVRANILDPSKIAAMYIKFTFTEIDFIYDKLGSGKGVTAASGFTLADVIKLYLTYRRPVEGKERSTWPSPWYVRKSALKAVLDAYGITSMKSKKLSNLPPIYAMTPGRNTLYSQASLYNDPEEDIESDFDSFDPNLG